MSSRRLRRCATAALVAVAVTFSVPAVGHARPSAEEYAGINIQKLIFDLPASSWTGHFDAMERGGIEFVRFDALWRAVEPEAPRDGRHAYRWERFDHIVGELAKRGIRWLPIIAYATPWSAVSTAHYAAAPRDPAEFGEYAGAVARRYGANGSYWREHPEIPALPVGDYEIWNAPNNPAHYHPGPNPAHYADMYLAAREAVRAADPAADVWVGGLAGVDAADFVQRMYAARAQLQGKVDAVAIHPYAADAERALSHVLELRRTLDALGEGTVGIPVSEIGWSTRGEQPAPIADERRAQYIATLAEQLAQSDCGVWTFMPHTWSTSQRNPFQRADWFGFWDPDLVSPNATGRAYLAVLRRLDRVRGATIPLCDRRLDVTVSSRSSTVGRAGRRAASGGNQPRAGRSLRRNCHRARASLASAPLPGATLTFHYLERRGRKARPRVVTRTTGENGVTAVCRSRSVGRRSRRPLELRRVTASHPDLAHGGAAVRRLRLP